MRKQAPLVSIVIPVYNRATLVERAIRSALAQTYENIEVVVSDNQSTDGTFEIVQSYMRQDPRVVGHQNPENLGAVRNWIKGIELSRGEFVRLLFSDDWLEPQSIERMLAPMLEDPEIGFCYSAVEMHEDARHYSIYQLKTEGRMDSMEFLHLLLSGTNLVPVSPCCALFRREDARRFIPERLPPYQGFDGNRYGVGNDVMLYLRTCARYPYCYYLPEPRTNFLAHVTSFSGNVAAVAPYQLELCYCHAYDWFLQQETLPAAAKRRLWRDLTWYRFRLRFYAFHPLLRKTLVWREKAKSLFHRILGSTE